MNKRLLVIGRSTLISALCSARAITAIVVRRARRSNAPTAEVTGVGKLYLVPAVDDQYRSIRS